MDLLSQVLRLVNLEGAVFVNGEFSSPWTVREPESCVLAPYLSPAAGHMMIYHLLTDGRAWAQADGGQRVELSAGDIVLFPHGHAHLLGNGPSAPPLDVRPNIERILSLGLDVSHYGGGGEITRFICGYMACDAELHRMLLGSLPPLVKINLRDHPSGVWIEKSLRYSVDHLSASGPGASAVIAKLSEVLFLETMRLYVSLMPESETGWLAGARDPIVGRALTFLHQDPAHRWTLNSLATKTGVSRAVLAARFKQFLGEPAIAYLTRWRLRLGARLLTSSTETVSAIALRVGYDSEAAFNRAFKRALGAPPAQYRKSSRSISAAATA